VFRCQEGGSELTVTFLKPETRHLDSLPPTFVGGILEAGYP